MRRRNKLKIQWLLLSVIITLTISGTFLLKKPELNANYLFKTTSGPTVVASSKFSLAPFRTVTKSLAELGKMDEINAHVLFLNYMPKSGAEILIFLLEKMQGINNFRHVRLKGGTRKRMTRPEEEELVYEIYNKIRNGAVPLSFDRHVHFINFTLFDRQSPTFINLIREPADKVLSRLSYNNNKQDNFIKCLINDGKKCDFYKIINDLSVPIFCGNDPECFIINSQRALQTAKTNVERYYPVVGVLEELNATLEILEHKIPYFFKGVDRFYQQHLLYNFNHKKKLEAVKKIQNNLRIALSKEYEFYEWIKSRLFEQLQILYSKHAH